MTFAQLELIKPLLDALTKKGYESPSPIQEKAIPPILLGKDIFGCAQTGTGKTAAFALPILQLMNANKTPNKRREIKALILAPTRELASQISENFKEYGSNLGFVHHTIFGGVSQFHQVEAIRKGVDILIATPGRLLDLMNQGIVKLGGIEYFVLDEADRMLDMGFINDIKKVIAKLPVKRQTMFFSATAAPNIMKLANTILKNPVSVAVNPVSSTATLIKQTVYFVQKTKKTDLLKHIIKTEKINHVLIFTRTKHGADKVAKALNAFNIKAEAIHGNKSQNNRERALKGFKDRTLQVLVATDIASRGIDVDKLTHVINFEIPEQAETYVHRIGRTGRAGEKGEAISFCSHEELPYFKQIQKLIQKEIDVVKNLYFLKENDYEKFEAVIGSMRGATETEIKRRNHRTPTIYFQYQRVLSGSPDRDFCMSIENRYFRRLEIDLLRDTNTEFGHERQPYSKWLYKGGPNCVHAWHKYLVQGNVISDQGMAPGTPGIPPKQLPNNGYYSPETKRKSEVAYIISQQGMSKMGFKSDDEKRMVYSPLMIPNILIPRLDDNNEKYFVRFTPQVIEKIQNLYMIEKRLDKTNYEHTENKMESVVMVESWIVSGESDKAYELGFTKDNVPMGTWMAGFKVLDTEEGDYIWNEFIKKGKVKGFSVEGNFIMNFSRQENDEYLLQEIINIIKQIND